MFRVFFFSFTSFFIFAFRLHSAPAVLPHEILSNLVLSDLASHQQWLNLIHYKTTVFGGIKSQVTSPIFFMSPEGVSDPYRELVADFNAFLLPPEKDSNLHAQCRFPARFHWLTSQLARYKISWPAIHCASFEEFRDRMDAKSVSVVFSSYFLNNPSSAFGHLLLRLNKMKQSLTRDENRFELLDFGINYAAVVDTSNAFVYGFKGLFGFFPGTFTAQPYYFKVREYNDFESRDLWSYELSLQEEEVNLLVKHLWELGPVHFQYFYLTQNCAYHILSVIEAVAPAYSLTDRLPFYAIPSDSLKALASYPGLVRHIHFRPSPRTSFFYRLRFLNDEQKDWLRRIVLKQDWSDAPADEDLQLQVMDAAIDYLDFKEAKDLLQKEQFATERKQNILVHRAQILKPSLNLKIEPHKNDLPHAGHNSLRLSARYGFTQNKESSIGIEIRFALHDLLDPQTGYPEYAQIEFFKTLLRYTWQAKDFWLEDLSAFHVRSLTPFSEFDRRLSWKFRLGAETLRDRNCDNCLAGTVEGGAGLTFQKSLFTAFIFPDAELTSSPALLNHFVRVGLGANAGLRVMANVDFQILFEGGYRYQFLMKFPHTYFGSVNSRILVAKNTALDLKAIKWSREMEGSLGLMHYF